MRPRSSAFAPRREWCGQVAGWSGRRPRSSRTATGLAGSRRPESGWPSTLRPTSRGAGTGTGTAMAQRAEEVMARFLGPENVEPSEAYLAELDGELHRYIVEFVHGDSRPRRHPRRGRTELHARAH